MTAAFGQEINELLVGLDLFDYRVPSGGVRFSLSDFESDAQAFTAPCRALCMADSSSAICLAVGQLLAFRLRDPPMATSGGNPTSTFETMRDQGSRSSASLTSAISLVMSLTFVWPCLARLSRLGIYGLNLLLYYTSSAHLSIRKVGYE